MRKEADDEYRKARRARKAMTDLTNVVDEGVLLSGAIAQKGNLKEKKRK